MLCPVANDIGVSSLRRYHFSFRGINTNRHYLIGRDELYSFNNLDTHNLYVLCPLRQQSSKK